MATNFQLAQGFSLPSIDYTLTKPVDYSAAADQIINWMPNRRARAIQKQEQEAILGGSLMRSEAKVGPKGAVTSGYEDPMMAQLKYNVESAKASNYGSMDALRQQQAAQGWARVGQGAERVTQGQARTDAYVDKTQKTTPGASFRVPGGTGWNVPGSALIEPDLPSWEMPTLPQGNVGQQDSISGATDAGDDEFEYLLLE